MQTFRNNLVRLRTASGLSQEALARLMDVSVRTVARYESGDSTPGLPVLQSLASALGCEIADLVTPAV